MKNSGYLMVWAVLSAFFWSSCSQQANEGDGTLQEAASQATIDTSVLPSQDGKERYIATLQIEGMGCAMACGSKISGALAGLNGVHETEIDFVGAGETNSAIVSFDASVISEAEMVRAVNEMKGGHYEVKHVQIVHYTPAELNDTIPTGASDEDKVSLFAPKLDYKLPNIFSVFSQLF